MSAPTNSCLNHLSAAEPNLIVKSLNHLAVIGNDSNMALKNKVAPARDPQMGLTASKCRLRYLRKTNFSSSWSNTPLSYPAYICLVS